jgi:hypothetical protein
MNERQTELTTEQLEALGEATRVVTTWFNDVLTPAMQLMAQAFSDLAITLGLDTRKGRRRMRKAIELEQHRERVAARVPEWKRRNG